MVEGDRIATLNSVDLRVPRDEQGDPRAADARRARFTRELERLRPGDRVTLRVYGDGRWRTVTATTARSADVYRTQSFQFGPGFLPALPRTLELSPLRGFPRPVRPTRRIVAL